MSGPPSKRLKTTARSHNELFAWLAECGTKLSHLAVESDGDAGDCVKLTETVAEGQPSVLVPHECVLTVEKAWTSGLGRTIAMLATDQKCSDELMLWLFMAQGRARHKEGHKENNNWACYLASLPETADIPATWDKARFEQELKGTPLHGIVNTERETISAEFAAVSKALGQVPGISWEGVLWAHSMFRSRSFPGHLSAGQSTNGCMVPLLDLLNHKHHEDVKWESTTEGIAFTPTQPKVKGSQLFNDYGSKGNADLLFSYGFCLHPNPDDRVPIVLCTPRDELHHYRLELCLAHGLPCHDNAPEPLWIGPFELAAEEQGGLPMELCAAMAICLVQSKGDEPEVGTDALVQLKDLFQKKISALPFSEEEDQKRLAAGPSGGAHPAAYRLGQRRILTDAIAEVVQEFQNRYHEEGGGDGGHG